MSMVFKALSAREAQDTIDQHNGPTRQIHGEFRFSIVLMNRHSTDMYIIASTLVHIADLL